MNPLPKLIKRHAVVTLHLGESCGQGAFWTVYRVGSIGGISPSIPLIIKICSLSEFADESDEDYMSEQASAAIQRDFEMMSRPAAKLQGTVVPTVHGLHAGKRSGKEVWTMMMEDCGTVVELETLLYHKKSVSIQPLVDPLSFSSSPALNLNPYRRLRLRFLRQIIFKQYEAFHPAGTLHSDVRVQNWLRLGSLSRTSKERGQRCRWKLQVGRR